MKAAKKRKIWKSAETTWETHQMESVLKNHRGKFAREKYEEKAGRSTRETFKTEKNVGKCTWRKIIKQLRKLRWNLCCLEKNLRKIMEFAVFVLKTSSKIIEKRCEKHTGT